MMLGNQSMRILRAKMILWILLTLPATVFLFRFFTGGTSGSLIASSGEWSARLIIVALMLTPLMKLFPGYAAVRWLLRHRRAFGVAAFAYAFLHLVFYVLDMETIANMVAELSAPAIWTAWLAFVLLLPPALASSDAAMRSLGRWWKRIQRPILPRSLPLCTGCWFTTE